MDTLLHPSNEPLSSDEYEFLVDALDCFKQPIDTQALTIPVLRTCVSTLALPSTTGSLFPEVPDTRLSSFSFSSFKSPLIEKSLSLQPDDEISLANYKKCRKSKCFGRAVAYGYCEPHSAARNCQVPGCHKRSQTKGRCFSHGGGKRCSVADCTKGVQKRGVCSRHGASDECSVEDCNRKVRCRRLCASHIGIKNALVDQ